MLVGDLREEKTRCHEELREPDSRLVKLSK